MAISIQSPTLSTLHARVVGQQDTKVIFSKHGPTPLQVRLPLQPSPRLWIWKHSKGNSGKSRPWSNPASLEKMDTWRFRSGTWSYQPEERTQPEMSPIRFFRAYWPTRWDTPAVYKPASAVPCYYKNRSYGFSECHKISCWLIPSLKFTLLSDHNILNMKNKQFNMKNNYYSSYNKLKFEHLRSSQITISKDF